MDFAELFGEAFADILRYAVLLPLTALAVGYILGIIIPAL